MRVRKIKLPVLFLKEGKQFIAYTPALDISTCGDTFDQAKERFEHLVDIFFEEIELMGSLKDVLLECGWKKKVIAGQRSEFIPPRFIANTEETFKVRV